MKDTLEILQDHTFPSVSCGIILAPTYHAKLNGVPMPLGDAVQSYLDNGENPPLNLPSLPGFVWGPRTKAKPAACSYCASIVTGNRCESCGAPRNAEREESRTKRFLVLKGITGTNADDPKMGQF